MEENVALDSSKQKQFVKSIKGIKKLIKKNEGKSASVDNIPKIKDGGIRKKKHKARGLVYLSHIPHGFYEHEMTQYFKQFGVVTNARVIRSKRTGNSKGYAFVEFKEPSVGEIVAETMNNYLMGKRLIKAAYVPPEKQKQRAMRKHWNAINNPGNNYRIKMKKAYNANRDEAGELQRAKKLLQNLNRNKKKLAELGINYEFFTPVDVPEVLLTKEPVKKEKGEHKENVVDNDESVIKTKKKKTKKSKTTEDLKNIENQKPVQELQEKDVKNRHKIKKEAKNAQEKEAIKKLKQKCQNLKDKGVKPPEDFIKVQDESDSDDSTYQFDSDEYEKMLENEDEFNSDVTSGDKSESADENSKLSEQSSDNGIDESVDGFSLIRSKVKPGLVKEAKVVQIKHPIKQMQKNLPQQAKRKASEKMASAVPATIKKSKFKKNKPLTSKQMKKKK